MTKKPVQVGEIYPEICKSYIKTIRKKSKSFGHRIAYRQTMFYPLKYQEIDGYSWRNPKEHLPELFDLVQIKTERRVLPGWHDGDGWCARTMRSDESAVAWRKKKDEI